MTSSSPQIDPRESIKTGINRRTVVRSAAWSVPVIAAAVAMPLAAASGPADDARITAVVGGGIAADGTAGTATGNYSTSGVSISGVTGTFSTGTLTAKYILQGPWNTGRITKPDGALFAVGETITHGGTVWTVSVVDSDAANIWEVHFTGAAVTVTGDMVVSMPPAIYSGTFTPGTPTVRNPVAGQVSVAAAEINGGVGVTSASGYPA